MQPSASRRLLKPVIILVALLALAWLAHQAYRVWQFETLFAPQRIVENFRSMPELFDSNLIPDSGPVFELEVAPQQLPQDFSFQGRTIAISDWIKTSGTTGLVVLANGKLVFEDYYQGNDAQSQAISWSVGKSFVSALIGFALADGSISSLQDPVGDYVPLLRQSGYADVSIQDVLEMSSGIDFNEDYADPQSGINQLGEEIFLGRSTNEWIARLQMAGPAGREHHYISVNTQVLGMVLEAATGEKLASYMEKKLWSRLGPEGDARWLTDAHGTELAFAGLNVRTRDYARFGQLYLDQGRNLKGEQLLPAQWVQDSVTPRTAYLQPGRSRFEGIPALGYAYQFWIPQGNEGEFMAIGVYGQFIYVNPTRQVVIAKNSAYADYNVDGDRMEYEALEAFRAIARKLGSGAN
ncbi:CubicO group peptidase, beta-lactamase class C family [Pseudomonas pohangensis]|uniref:CubicO group peptidase, beta-lactamase class C family n=1 Tax=Pseudomonas pohangensis TaxID=364197 RepID=A0A1H2HUH8_9PSED|nr:serine hydrolase [Pseudomonas pohangensis]SDU35517.1 CubicO group peptidase, beta-lactamase class C family [Pseudomonas pohangensis]